MDNIQLLAREYHDAIRTVLSIKERVKLDAAIAKGTGNEHDIMDANDQLMETYEEAFGKEVFNEEGHIDDETIELLNAAVAAAQANGFKNNWKA